MPMKITPFKRSDDPQYIDPTKTPAPNPPKDPEPMNDIGSVKPDKLDEIADRAYDIIGDGPVEKKEDKLDQIAERAYNAILKEELEQPSFKKALEVSVNYIKANNALESPRSNFADTKTAIMATEARVPIDYAVKNPEETQERIYHRKSQRQKLLPAVAKGIANDPNATAILAQDIDNFNKLHAILNQEQFTEGDVHASFFDKIATAWNAGSATADMAEHADAIRDALSQGLPIPENIVNEMNELNLIASGGTWDGSIASQMAVATSQILKPLIDSTGHAIVGGVAGAGVGAGAGSVFPGGGTAIGAGIGANIGALSGFVENTYDQTYSSTAFHYSNLEVDGKPLDSEIVNAAAVIESTISSSLDLVSFSVLGRLFGIAGNSVRGIVSSALTTPAGQAVIAGLGRRLAKASLEIGVATGTEATVEATQEIVFDAFAELAKQWTSESRGGDYEAKSMFRPEVIDSAIDSAFMAMKATPLLAGAPMVIPHIARTVSKAMKHQSAMDEEIANEERLNASIEIMSEMLSRETNAGQTVATDILRQNNMETTYLDAVDVQGHLDGLEQRGVNAENTPWIANIQTELELARKEGRKLEVPTVKMIEILGEKDGKEFIKLITTDENSSTPQRRDETNTTIAEIINNELVEATEIQERENELSTLVKSSLEVLGNTGVLSKNSAKMLSTLIPRWATTVTEGTKLKPAELIRDFGLKIEGAYKNFESKDFANALGTYDPNSKTINLSNQQNLTTFLHETAHFFFDFEQMIGDVSRIDPILPLMAKEIGVEESVIREVFTNPLSNKDLFVDMHEFFARKFEAYIMEGKAPSAELAKEFRVWREWMAFNYTQETPLGMQIDEESQNMFDNILTAQQFSEEVKQEMLYNDLIAEEITDDIKQKQSIIAERKSEEDKIISLFFKSLKRKQTKSYRIEASKAKEEAIEIVNAAPVNVLQEIVKDPMFKFDRSEIKKLLGKIEIPSRLLRLSKKDGNPIADITSTFEIFAEKSPLEVINEIINAPTKQDAVKHITKKIMNERVVPYSDAALMNKVVESIRSKSIANGLLSILNKAMAENGKNSISREAINNSAIDALYGMTVKSVTRNPFSSREKRAAINYKTALREKDSNGVEFHARERLLNFFMGKGQVIFKKDLAKIKSYLNGYKKSKQLNKLDIAGEDFLSRVETLLAKAGILDPSLAGGSEIIALADMTVGQVYALNDTVKSIETAASNAKKAILGKEQVDLENLVKTITDELYAGSENIDLSVTVNDQVNPIVSAVSALESNLTIIPWILKSLTNAKGRTQSITQEALDTPLSLASHKYFSLFKEHLMPVIDQFNNKKEFTKWNEQNHHIESLVGNKLFNKDGNGNLKGEKLLAFALNLGTQKNLDKLLKGYELIGIEEDATLNHPVVKEIVSKLGKDQWAMVKVIWKQMDALFPMLADIAKRHKGITLEREVPSQIILPDGKIIEGGYFPLFRDKSIEQGKRDGHNVIELTTDKLFSGDNNSNSFDPSSIHARTGAIYPVSLSMDGNTMGHFKEVIHYISHYDAVDSANKIITHGDFRKAYQKVAGQNELNAIDLWIKEVASNSVATRSDIINSGLKRTRYGVTVAVLGAKIGTVLKQTLGWFNAVPELGNGSTVKGTISLLKAMRVLSTENRQALVDDMMAVSSVMKDRINHSTFDRDIAEINESLKGQNSKKAKWNNAIMTPIAMMQFYIVDTPTWIAARQLSLDDSMANGANYNDALKSSAKYADSVVERTQASSLQKNLPSVLRKQSAEGTRMLFMFMTAMMSIHNQGVDTVRGKRRGNYSNSETATRIFTIFLLPALTLALINWARSDDDEMELTDELIKQSISSFFGVVPLGDFTVSAIQGNVRNVGGFGTVGHGIAGSWKLADNMFQSYYNNEEFDKDANIRNMRQFLMLASVLSGYGGALQIGAVAAALADIEAWDDMKTWEIIQSFVNGPKKN